MLMKEYDLNCCGYKKIVKFIVNNNNICSSKLFIGPSSIFIYFEVA
jgi:hypothetical protein